MGMNARLRFTFRPGNDLFVVWNRNWTHRPAKDASTSARRATRSRSRSASPGRADAELST